MLLRQSFKDMGCHPPREYMVQDLEQAASIVALLNIAYSYAKEKALDGNINEAIYIICKEHELHGELGKMLGDFGDCIFTLVMPNGSEFIMNPDFIQFDNPEEVAADDNV